jgi:hypothetical protein
MTNRRSEVLNLGSSNSLTRPGGTRNCSAKRVTKCSRKVLWDWTSKAGRVRTHPKVNWISDCFGLIAHTRGRTMNTRALALSPPGWRKFLKASACSAGFLAGPASARRRGAHQRTHAPASGRRRMQGASVFLVSWICTPRLSVSPTWRTWLLPKAWCPFDVARRRRATSSAVQLAPPVAAAAAAAEAADDAAAAAAAAGSGAAAGDPHPSAGRLVDSGTSYLAGSPLWANTRSEGFLSFHFRA